MKVLIVGSGAREQALLWKLKQSSVANEVFVQGGSVDDVLAAVTNNSVDFVVVGPDNYLAEGIVDRLQEKGILAFGPTKAAAKIEWSKAFAKQFMIEEGIPTAKFFTCDLYEDALHRSTTMVQNTGCVVIKLDGLARGKGVVVAKSVEEVEVALRDFMHDKLRKIVVVEEFLEGKEISLHALCDGERAVMFPPSKDHKRAYDNDEGPMTGGMGTIAPVPCVTESDMKEIEEKIILPTLRALKKRGTPFKGLLFPGIMLTETGPKVIEFNARFGDPETESYMRILGSDLLPALVASAKGDLSDTKLIWKNSVAATIVLASGGYPGQYTVGYPISGIEEAENDPDVIVFHFATKLERGVLCTNGGRVLGVSATGVDLHDALRRAYMAAHKIHFEGVQYRTDIGMKSLL